MFQTLTSNRLSRNKYFTQFSNQWFKAVHRRYRIVTSLKNEAARLGSLPGTQCWISHNGDSTVRQLHFHLRSPRLNYSRVVALELYEWEWLEQQKEIRLLMQAQARDVLTN